MREKPERLKLESDQPKKPIRKTNQTKEPLSKEMKNAQAKSSFPVITKITTQRRKGRYNIYLDDVYAFAVDEGLLVKHLLRKGMEISPQKQIELEEEDESKKAYQRSLVYLQYGLRSEKEVRDDLISKDFEANADDVIDILIDQRLINDKEYAKSYTRTAANLNRKGPRVIDRELVKKGIKESDRLEAMEEYSFEQQLENALYLGEKVITRSSRRSSRETQQKVREYLMQKGFQSDVINETLPQLNTEKDEEDEMAALEQHGEKAWRRYRKEDKYKRIQKTKANLFQKAYPMELITQYIDKKVSEDEDDE